MSIRSKLAKYFPGMSPDDHDAWYRVEGRDPGDLACVYDVKLETADRRLADHVCMTMYACGYDVVWTQQRGPELRLLRSSMHLEGQQEVMPETQLLEPTVRLGAA